MKKRICGAFVALLWMISGSLTAGAVNFGIFQGHVVDSSLEEEESEIIQGHILDGVTAEDGGASAKSVPAPSFTVTFVPNGDGASVSPATKRVTNGRAYGELPQPVRDGYVFDYWRTAAGEKITANHIVNLNANESLYAEWRLPTCEVRFDANGGSVRELAIDIPLGGDYGELPQPVRDGYLFLGWYTQPQGGGRVVNHAALTNTDDHTLYAHWFALPVSTDAQEDFSAVFQDVPTTSSYYPAVYWAVQKGITSGTSPETFSPNEPCKRRHILTFLWRANGCPEPIGTLGGSPSGTANAADGFWAKGAVWAYEHTLIPAPFSYNGEESSTRSDAVTYLWKLAGCPMEESLQAVVERFTDVSPESDYAPAVAWALDAGITNGTTETTFSPERICTRGQIVTFLYRCYTR